jgi:DNA-binding CsgD family transcriptional regulator
MTTPNDEKPMKNHFSLNIPSELRPEFEEMVTRENATRMVYGFIVAGLAQLAFLWQDWQRSQHGMFEQHSAYRWIFYNHLAWWLMMWIPVEFAWNWSRIRNGQYPLRRLKRLVGIGIVWAWAFQLMVGALNFQVNHTLDHFAAALVIASIFILKVKTRFWLSLISAAVMSAIVFFQTDLSKLQIQFVPFSILIWTLMIFLFSIVWYNKMAQQFLDEKMLMAQKCQLSEQGEILAAQNLIIENDKTRLVQQLEGSYRQLSIFALRLAQNGDFLNEVKTVIETINTSDGESTDKKKRLMRKIEQESANENNWQQFREQFELVHPHFFTAILKRFPTLNTSELRLLSFLKMNLDTQEISAILGISLQSVNTARYRLRKHLGLATEVGLSEFLQRFQ